MIVLRRPTYTWPRRYWPDPLGGVDDDRARAKLGEASGFWDGMAIGVENRTWCDALHRGRWPK
jgi:hypothetical protein